MYCTWHCVEARWQRYNTTDQLSMSFFPAFVVSYSTLQTQVCDVENATALHEIELCCVVTTLAWCADNKIYCNSEDDMSIEAIAEKFLPPLPAFHKRSFDKKTFFQILNTGLVLVRQKLPINLMLKIRSAYSKLGGN